MKIAIVGPAFPWRGGIAHHTNILAEHLRKLGHRVDIITFTRQYPSFLYPGATQREAGAENLPLPEGTAQMIDSMNPVSWFRVRRLLRRRGYDLILFKFWLPLFGLCFGTIARGVLGRVVVIIDNLIPHEKRPGDRFLTRYFLHACRAAVTQSSVVRDQLSELFPQLPQVMLPHPTYEQFGARIDRRESHERLGIDAKKVLLFFGFIRRYKGLDRLLAAMPRILERVPDARLYVVGEFFEEKEPYLAAVQQGGVEEQVTFVDRYIPNEEVASWFSAADLLVLPYHSATNSGIVQIGYNFATPAIVTNVGSLAEVVIDGVTGYVLEDGTPEEIADAVARAYQPGRLEEFSEQIRRERDRYTWKGFAECLVEFARGVIGGG